MAYKIAVASSDGVNIDLSFGAAKEFRIYEVEHKKYALAEIRKCPEQAAQQSTPHKSGCHGQGSCGCTSVAADPKVQLIADCRCILCGKIGGNAKKQLEKKAIAVFDIELELQTALDKVTAYYR